MAPYGGAGFGPYVAFAPPLDQIESRIRQSDAYRNRSNTRSVKRHSSDAFVSTGKRIQLVERKMSQRLNQDRKVGLSELYDSLYPVRSVVTESSFQLANPVGQKMTCMNVFRHQDLGVLDKEAATTAAMTSGQQGWGSVTHQIVAPISSSNLTQSGYVMRGYGVTLQNSSTNNVTVQAQMSIAPGNHLPGVSQLGDNEYNQLVGNRFNLDMPKFTSVFDGHNDENGSNDVHYPNLDQDLIGVADIMGCCQTLWSPVCAQSIEAASANLGYNSLGKGTVSQVAGHLNTLQKTQSEPLLDFGPVSPDRNDNTKAIPRELFDAESCMFTWNKHSVDYKFTNTYTYPVDVEVVVFKAHGLTSRQGFGDPANETRQGSPVTEYYPGFNGPLPWSSTKGGIFDIIFGSQANPNTSKSQTANRIMAMDFINAWTNHLGVAQRGREGIQLPEDNITNYPSPSFGQHGRYQMSAKPHWPLVNARWRNWQLPKGASAGTNFMREFSRKSMRIRVGEQVSLDLDLGGFKYSLADVGYLTKPISEAGATPGEHNFFEDLQWTVSGQDVNTKPVYHYANKGLMNGSVVVSITMKGTPCAANAPLLAFGPDYPGPPNANATSISIGDVPPIIDIGTGGSQPVGPLPVEAVPRGYYASGTTHSAGTLLVECKEKISFQPMMNKRPKFETNTATHTNHSLLLQPQCPVDSTVRTTDSTAVKTYTNTVVRNTDTDKTANT